MQLIYLFNYCVFTEWKLVVKSQSWNRTLQIEKKNAYHPEGTAKALPMGYTWFLFLITLSLMNKNGWFANTHEIRFLNAKKNPLLYTLLGRQSVECSQTTSPINHSSHRPHSIIESASDSITCTNSSAKWITHSDWSHEWNDRFT